MTDGFKRKITRITFYLVFLQLDNKFVKVCLFDSGIYFIIFVELLNKIRKLNMKYKMVD